jgi:hypothetical protein
MIYSSKLQLFWITYLNSIGYNDVRETKIEHLRSQCIKIPFRQSRRQCRGKCIDNIVTGIFQTGCISRTVPTASLFDKRKVSTSRIFGEIIHDCLLNPFPVRFLFITDACL